MFSSFSSRSPFTLLLVVLCSVGTLVLLNWQPGQPILSSWAAPIQRGLHSSGLDGAFVPQPLMGRAALERYNQSSELRENVGDGLVRLYHRDLPNNGALDYMVVLLDPQVHIEVVSADGATPGSDPSGDTIWTDGKTHLATVEEIAHAPYAARAGLDLLGAMAFGFHGDVRTSNEGTVVVNRQVLRVNSGRSALCISGGNAEIGLFDAERVRQCDQAIGAGPVILWQGKIANPHVTHADAQYIPFNPLGEDFVQLDWRRQVYSGSYPKSVVGVGADPDGTSYLVMLVSYGVSGVDLVAQLQSMGCSAALGGDDDTSTQAVWRGQPLHPRAVQKVPDALAIYIQQK